MLTFTDLQVEFMSHLPLRLLFHLSIRQLREWLPKSVGRVTKTSSSHASPTPSGTIPNCGLYYLVEDSDDYSLVSEKFGLTF